MTRLRMASTQLGNTWRVWSEWEMALRAQWILWFGESHWLYSFRPPTPLPIPSFRRWTPADGYILHKEGYGCWLEGATAHSKGKWLNANPYGMDTRKGQHWLNGFLLQDPDGFTTISKDDVTQAIKDLEHSKGPSLEALSGFLVQLMSDTI